MNTTNKTIAAIVLSCATLSIANAAPTVVAADAEMGTKLCVIASKGKVIQMAKVLKESNLTKRYVATKITCNQHSIISFVEQYGKNAERMNRYLTSGNDQAVLISRVSTD